MGALYELQIPQNLCEVVKFSIFNGKSFQFSSCSFLGLDLLGYDSVFLCMSSHRVAIPFVLGINNLYLTIFITIEMYQIMHVLTTHGIRKNSFLINFLILYLKFDCFIICTICTMIQLLTHRLFILYSKISFKVVI